MADGKIVIDTDLDSSGIENALDGLQGNLKGISKLGDIFDVLSKNSANFGKAFGVASKLVSSGAATAIAGVVALGAAFVKLYEASKQNFAKNISDIGNAIAPVIGILKSLGTEMLAVFSSVTGFELSFSSLISEAIEFESTMASVAAIMGATGDGINQITQTARQFGAETRYTATQVAEAFTYMGMAGWSAAESVTGIADVLNLATIGSTSLATSSDIVTDGLTQLGMSANQAGNFVDMMAATITGSNTNVEMMGEVSPLRAISVEAKLIA